MARNPTPPRPRPIETRSARFSAMKRSRQRGGTTQFYWRGRRKGDRAVVWSGWGTRDEVQQIVTTLEAEGRLEARQRVRRAEATTVRDVIEIWLDHQKSRLDLSPNTIDHYDKNARHQVAWLGDLGVSGLSRDVLEGYRNDRLGEDASPRLVAQELLTLRMAWRWARDRGLVPGRNLPPVKVKIEGFVINHRTPDPAEIPLVFAVLTGLYLLIVQLLAITGARVSEICAVVRGDLDLRRRQLAFDGKTGPREFPLPEEIARALAERLDGTDGPLLDRSQKVASQMVRDRLRRACKTSGVPVFTPHGLRRMVVNRMIRAGVDPKTASSLTGHSVEVMLRFYQEVSDEDRRRAVRLAGLGHFPTAGAVVQGPWDAQATENTGTENGHNGSK